MSGNATAFDGFDDYDNDLNPEMLPGDPELIEILRDDVAYFPDPAADPSLLNRTIHHLLQEAEWEEGPDQALVEMLQAEADCLPDPAADAEVLSRTVKHLLQRAEREEWELVENPKPARGSAQLECAN